MRRFYLSVVDKPLVDTKRDLPKRAGPLNLYQSDIYSSTAACTAANFMESLQNIKYLHNDWSTFYVHFSCILHVLHVADSHSFA